jgi:hypothetical protein
VSEEMRDESGTTLVMDAVGGGTPVVDAVDGVEGRRRADGTGRGTRANERGERGGPMNAGGGSEPISEARGREPMTGGGRDRKRRVDGIITPTYHSAVERRAA